MSNIVVIAEYNPFHNGHKLHIEEARRLADERNSREAVGRLEARESVGAPESCEACGSAGDHCVIAIMSGCFTQRGHLALFSKWKRAEAAVRCGADLVLELPVWASCGGAEVFAAGGVGLANRLGNIDFLAFGAENPEDELTETARLTEEENDEFSSAIKEGLSGGKSYAAARAEAFEATGHRTSAELLSKPNNILGVEYLRQLIRSKSSIKPLVVKRRYAGYFGESQKGFAGAGFIRERIKEGLPAGDLAGYIPPEALEFFADEKPVFMEDAFKLIVYKLISEDKNRLSEVDGAVEGLENRAVRSALQAIDYESLVDGIKSKRYSRTAVERLLVRTLLGITKKDVADFRRVEGAYARVLAFNDRGAAYLKDLKKNEKVTIISNVSKEAAEDPVFERMLRLDILAADLYNLIQEGRPGLEKKRHGIKVR